MDAIVTKPFLGVPDGDTQARRYEKGHKVSGSLAKVAVTEEWAFDPENTKKLTEEQKQALEISEPKNNEGSADQTANTGE